MKTPIGVASVAEGDGCYARLLGVVMSVNLSRLGLLCLALIPALLLGACAKQQQPATSGPVEPAPGTTMTDPKTGIELAYIPAGTFLMGSPAGEEEYLRNRGVDPDDLGYLDYETQHEVTLTKPFWMGTTEVTNAQYRRFVEATGHREPMFWHWYNSDYNRPDQPVVGVPWDAAVAYADWAGMSLPTEAQWEYAARAGTTTRYWSGDSESDLARVGWYDGNSDERLHAVGEKPANAWGLHDVHGNVWEWTADWFGDYPGSSQTDPTGPGSSSEEFGPRRVKRSGAFDYDADISTAAARMASRVGVHGGGGNGNLGFRLSRTIP